MDGKERDRLISICSSMDGFLHRLTESLYANDIETSKHENEGLVSWSNEIKRALGD